jgi:hypothetical protein
MKRKRKGREMVIDIPVSTMTLFCNCVPISGTSNRDMVEASMITQNTTIKISVLKKRNFQVSREMRQKEQTDISTRMESVVLQKAPAMDGRRPHITPHQKCTKWEFKNGAALRKHRSGTLAATNLKNAEER